MRLFTLLLLTITFLGCSKNDGNNPNEEIPSELIGKWKTVEIYTIEVDPPSWSAYDSGENYDIWFKANGEVTFGGRTDNCSKANYSIDGNSLYYSGNPCISENPATIEALSDSELILNLNHFEIFKSKFVKVTTE